MIGADLIGVGAVGTTIADGNIPSPPADRGVGVADALAGLDPTLAAVAAVLTQLADAWFVFALGALLYWLAPPVGSAPRRIGALLIGAGLATLAVTVGLKTLFALPRPPGAGTATPPGWLPTGLGGVYEAAATGDGFGFPSGHAIAATVVYGTLAAVADGFDRRRRVAGAAVIVAVVAATRVVLGVHYLVDVVVGVVAGGVGLAGLLAAAGYDPRASAPSSTLDLERAFAACTGGLIVAAGIAAAGGHTGEMLEAAVGVGGAVGAVAAWRVTGRGVAGEGPPPVSIAVAVPALVVTGGLWAGTYAAAPSLLVAFVGSAVAIGAVIALPALVDRATADRRD